MPKYSGYLLPSSSIVWDCYSSYLLSINIFLTTVLWVIIFFTSHLSLHFCGWAKKFFGLLPKNRRIRFRRGRQRLLISGVPVHQSLGGSVLLSNFEGVVESVSKALKHSRTKRRQIYESRGKTSERLNQQERRNAPRTWLTRTPPDPGATIQTMPICGTNPNYSARAVWNYYNCNEYIMISSIFDP
jgi:hypothetical protein